MMSDELKTARLSFIIHHSSFRISFLLRGHDPAPQNFRDAPSLRYAAARREGLDGVEDFADRADARFVEVWDEAFEKLARTRTVFGVDFEPSVYKRAYEPGPDSALMISGIARLEVAVVCRLEVRVVGRERTKADRLQ